MDASTWMHARPFDDKQHCPSTAGDELKSSQSSAKEGGKVLVKSELNTSLAHSLERKLFTTCPQAKMNANMLFVNMENTSWENSWMSAARWSDLDFETCDCTEATNHSESGMPNLCQKTLNFGSRSRNHLDSTLERPTQPRASVTRRSSHKAQGAPPRSCSHALNSQGTISPSARRASDLH